MNISHLSIFIHKAAATITTKYVLSGTSNTIKAGLIWCTNIVALFPETCIVFLSY